MLKPMGSQCLLVYSQCFVHGTLQAKCVAARYDRWLAQESPGTLTQLFEVSRLYGPAGKNSCQHLPYSTMVPGDHRDTKAQ